jgi:hypothetical protein
MDSCKLLIADDLSGTAERPVAILIFIPVLSGSGSEAPGEVLDANEEFLDSD